MRHCTNTRDFLAELSRYQDVKVIVKAAVKSYAGPNKYLIVERVMTYEHFGTTIPFIARPMTRFKTCHNS